MLYAMQYEIQFEQAKQHGLSKDIFMLMNKKSKQKS